MGIGWRLTRLLGDERGSYALEFAMIAPLFLVLLLETVDIGLTLLDQFTLDFAARTAARQVRTEQITGSGASAASTFDAVLCANTSGLIPCANIVFYVGSLTEFNSGTIPAFQSPPNGTQQTNPTGANFNPGGFNGATQTFNANVPGTSMVVRVAYDRPSLIPFANPWAILGHNQLNLASFTSTLLTSTVVFRNEPCTTCS